MQRDGLPEWAKAPLLPPSSSDLERDLDVALSHIETVVIPIETLWDPARCPVELLPYLAWAVHVSDWRSSWSEKVKRQVVADSLDIHRIRGTRPSVELALSSLDVKCDVVEWFERPDLEMEPGTFRVTAWVSEGDVPDPSMPEQIRDAVDSARPASRPFTLYVNGMAKVRYAAGAALRLSRAVLLHMEADGGWNPPTNQLRTELLASASLRVTQTKILKMESQ